MLLKISRIVAKTADTQLVLSTFTRNKIKQANTWACERWSEREGSPAQYESISTVLYTSVVVYRPGPGDHHNDLNLIQRSAARSPTAACFCYYYYFFFLLNHAISTISRDGGLMDWLFVRLRLIKSLSRRSSLALPHQTGLVFELTCPTLASSANWPKEEMIRST